MGWLGSPGVRVFSKAPSYRLAWPGSTTFPLAFPFPLPVTSANVIGSWYTGLIAGNEAFCFPLSGGFFFSAPEPTRKRSSLPGRFGVGGSSGGSSELASSLLEVDCFFKGVIASG